LRKIVSVLICAIVVFTAINQLYAKSISELNKERNQIKIETENTKKNLEDTKTEKSEVLLEVEELDKELNEAQEEFDRLTKQLEETKLKLQNSENDLENAIQKKENQYSSLKKRIRVMYENGSIGYLQVILNAETLSDCLKRIEYINRIMKYDKDVLNQYQKNQETIAQNVENIKTEKADIEILTSKQADKKQALDENIKIKEELVKKLTADEETYLQQINDLEKADQDVANLINEAQARASAISGSYTNKVYAYSGEKFQYPVPAYRGVNSDYGYRINPISGKQEFHTGLDLKATMGTDVVAAEDGVVIYAGNKGGYGKTVIIDHGNGISTLYAHNSSIVVSIGQTVKRGEVIAKAGTTGYSTGVHLHFEVRINGNHTNPTPYILE